MIVIVGRPALAGDGELSGTPALVALAAAEAGARVELVGSVGDDAEGDAAAVALGRAGVGHAALLRDPLGRTRRGDPDHASAPSRLEPADLQLALDYLPECRVLVLAEELEAGALAVVVEAARYHSAHLVVLVPAGAAEVDGLPSEATLLQLPSEAGSAFAQLVGRYAAALAAGQEPANAWRSAVAASGWSESPAESDEPPA